MAEEETAGAQAVGGGVMLLIYRRWELQQRLREQQDMAIIGSKLPREPMPIGMLFAELTRALDRRTSPVAGHKPWEVG